MNIYAILSEMFILFQFCFRLAKITEELENSKKNVEDLYPLFNHRF